AYGVTERLLDLPLPIVCAVQGRCAGAALAMVLSCDLRIATESAVFSLDFVRLGLSPDMGVCWLLGSAVGIGRALDFALSGELMDAQRALDWGIVTRVVPDGGERHASTPSRRSSSPARSASTRQPGWPPSGVWSAPLRSSAVRKRSRTRSRR
ncbi:MAG TPA: enoyl-CoA hydratase/isomerase family protein, partial [Ilumatobacteraceae bacterium]|nr:enoyl-CoA hydratase/isomerase family protein [Ilumatobacteraceae bacterium]